MLEITDLNLDDLAGDDEIKAPNHSQPKEEKPTYDKPYNKQYNNGNYNKGKSDKINMYEAEHIKAKEIITDSFEKVGRSFMVHTCDASDEVTEKIIKVSTKLISDGFVFRHNGNSEDVVQNKVLALCTEDGQSESYVPTKKDNELITKHISPNTYELPYQYACQLFGPSFNDKLGKGARAWYASKVHAVLGVESNNPIDFLLCFNKGGNEIYPVYRKEGPKIDYNKLGTLGFYLKITDKVNIPVYNFYNPESIKNLVNLIK